MGRSRNKPIQAFLNIKEQIINQDLIAAPSDCDEVFSVSKKEVEQENGR